MHYQIKVYNTSTNWKEKFLQLLNTIWKNWDGKRYTFWLFYSNWEVNYSIDCKESVFPWFESDFYTQFPEFQLVKQDKKHKFTPNKSVLYAITLENKWIYPFKRDDKTDFIWTIFRAFDNLDRENDIVSLNVQIIPEHVWWFWFQLMQKFEHRKLKTKIKLQFYKYIFDYQDKKWWQQKWDKYFSEKLNKKQFTTRISLIVQSSSQETAEWKAQMIFQKFAIFKDRPTNRFLLQRLSNSHLQSKDSNYLPSILLTSEEISSFFYFPENAQSENSLLSIKSKQLALPTKVLTLSTECEEDKSKLPEWVNLLGMSNYRSNKNLVWVYDQDRLRHVYTIWMTWVWKSKFLVNLMINDIYQWNWICVIDPHWDLVEEVMQHIPDSRKNDVIIFDPTDEKYPFAINPLDIQQWESKQVFAKWFIDIFKKYFGANWNSKLEHVLRMIFLALLDTPKATLFDIIRALTDKDFRYDMISNIQDDVVKNFWTNEFASWSQQFNTEAIMPILNKVWQLLSIESIKNIFASPENKLNMRQVMDNKKILLVNLPKWKIQEETMWFLGAMFVTKIFQAAMWRQDIDKADRIPFFLYIDEFQNFATDTFSEILSEARKYWLSLSLAHQFVKQIPQNISTALFWNVGTFACFRVSTEDGEYIKQLFQPFLTWYDLSNQNAREFYCKTLSQWQVTDPFSCISCYVPDVKIDKQKVDELYSISRKKYARSLEEVKARVQEQSDVMKTIEEFVEPII